MTGAFAGVQERVFHARVSARVSNYPLAPVTSGSDWLHSIRKNYDRGKKGFGFWERFDANIGMVGPSS
jgi:hypothetical protein